jgi:hypothetical protein
MKNILAKLHAIQAEVGKMEKDGYNDFQNYKYLSETQVTLKMKDLLDKHKVMFLPKSIEEKVVNEISPTSKGTKQYVTTVKITYAFADIETGEMYEGSIEGQGSDTADKGIYKAITGGIKYIFMKTFNIPTGDDPEKTIGSGKANNTPQEPLNGAGTNGLQNKCQCGQMFVERTVTVKRGTPEERQAQLLACPNATKENQAEHSKPVWL